MLRVLLVLVVTGSMLASMSAMVHAKDVSAQQAGAEYAREGLLKVEAEHQVNLKKLAETEKELAEIQKRLAVDKKAAEASSMKVEQAKAKLDKAQTLLDQAWKK
jgi:valyl-tRNA synthetase